MMYTGDGFLTLRTLHGKFLVTYVPIALLITLIFLTCFEWHTYRSARLALQRKLQGTLNAQLRTLLTDVWELNIAQIESELAALYAEPDFVGATVHDERGQLLASVGDVNSEHGSLHTRGDIVYTSDWDSGVVGSVQLVFTDAHVKTQTLSRLLVDASMAFVLLIAVVISVFFTNRFLVGIPMRKFLKSIELAEQSRDRQPVEWHSRDEIGRVIAAFNRMQVQQQHTEQELEKAHHELKRRVEERTLELAYALDRAETANRVKGTFLANMSHELRTPLHSILSFAGFGLKKADSATPGKFRDYFEQIDQSARALLTLLDSILDLAMLESDKMTFEFAPTDPCRLLNTVTDQLAPAAAARHLSVRVIVPHDHLKVRMDAAKISQVLRNLLNNAVKFSPEGGSIEIRLRQEAEEFFLSVADQGVGIPAEEMEAIFEKFFQSSKTKTGAGGIGLGLAICREIVTAHGGRIWATNRLEGGTIVTFTLPLAIPALVTSSANLTVT